MRSKHAAFLRFLLVGSAGYAIDVAALYLFCWCGLSVYIARILSYVVAASSTWLLHRRFTFPEARHAAVGRQWAKFLTVNAFGGCVNYGVFAVLVAQGGIFARAPELAVAVGSIVALAVNFNLSRWLVFAIRIEPSANVAASRDPA